MNNPESLTDQTIDSGSSGRCVLGNSKASNIESRLDLCKVYLENREYEKVFIESESIIKQQPCEFAAQNLKVEALLSLRRYKECLLFLTESVKNVQSSNPLNLQIPLEHFKSFKKFTKEAETYLDQEKNGSYDMGKFVPERRMRYDKVPEFKGPIKLCPFVPGKGRGVVACQDISAGQLILVSRAFEIVFDWDKDETKLETLIANKLTTTPDQCHLIDELFAGKDISQRSPNSTSSVLASAPDEENKLQVDFERIIKVCNFNCFGNPDPAANSRGLWIFPSYFNHDCIDFNCRWKCLGDLLFIRTTRVIGKNEELLISYTDTVQPFETRFELFKCYEFTCECRLCLHQSQEATNLKTRNSKRLMLQIATAMSSKKDVNDSQIQADIKYMKYCTEQFDEMGVASGKPEWNFSVCCLLKALICLYSKAGDIQGQKATIERYYEVVNGCPDKDGQGSICLERGAACYMVEACLNDFDLDGASKWVGILKNDLSLWFGKSDVFKLIYPNLYSKTVRLKVNL